MISHHWIKPLFLSIRVCVCVCLCAGRLEASVVDFVLSFLWQGRDLGSLRCCPLAGVEAVKRREEAQPVSGAHGLFQVTRLIQQLLDGVVAFHGAALDHLDRQAGGEDGYMFIWVSNLVFSRNI